MVVVAASERLDSSPWDVTSGRAVLHEEHSAIECSVIDQLELGGGHIREERLTP